ncbi:hypothetical protein AK812_SmicGene10281 [Symbiodinium microadriaticum]|uniref:Uncharacterized protein n=1 Tax=Symbiodinium microadriaticum TaxID=2951 RepID=A0A1Q9EG73_SYMMI|nr:hypothetical protein AK812_SmicGene10281 [Symbiodinium microadriaticum]
MSRTFSGWFALAPLGLEVATSMGTCENQLFPPTDFPTRPAYLKFKNLKSGLSYCQYGVLKEDGKLIDCKDVPADVVSAEEKEKYRPQVLAKCVCTPGTECKSVTYSANGSGELLVRITAEVMSRYPDWWTIGDTNEVHDHELALLATLEKGDRLEIVRASDGGGNLRGTHADSQAELDQANQITREVGVDSYFELQVLTDLWDAETNLPELVVAVLNTAGMRLPLKGPMEVLTDLWDAETNLPELVVAVLNTVAQEVMGSRRPEVEAQVEEVPMRVWKELEEGQQAPVVEKWRYQAMVVVMTCREYRSDWTPYTRDSEKWPLTPGCGAATSAAYDALVRRIEPDLKEELDPYALWCRGSWDWRWRRAVNTCACAFTGDSIWQGSYGAAVHGLPELCAPRTGPDIAETLPPAQRRATGSARCRGQEEEGRGHQGEEKKREKHTESPEQHPLGGKKPDDGPGGGDDYGSFGFSVLQQFG